jgi:2-amino-4-hydroxy-6-hydroxymethyldihydropteridine diphosphokinase
MGEIAYVALGSNLGDRTAALSIARAAIALLPRTRVLGESPVEETAAIGPAGQGDYLNQMLALETDLAPHELLDALQSIERVAGRERGVHWGPRTLDLDIVKFGSQRIADDRLVVPHPGLADRAFWQRELEFLGGSRA